MLLAVPGAFCLSLGTENGKICGTVLDESGNPAANVHVIAILQSSAGHSGGFPGTRADEVGRYCINGLPLGNYLLTADDEGLGYPMRGSTFFTWSSPLPKVALSRQRPNSSFDWKIPFRAAFLYLHLPAAHSRDEITPITIKLVVHSRPNLGLMTIVTRTELGKSKELHILLPPQEDVLLTVSAPSYQRWPNDGSEGKLLNLLSGVIQDIVVPPPEREATR
jgi:hypothetical protein